MRLHVIYRSHGQENAKGRPPFYSKRLGLESVVRSMQGCPPGSVDLVFLNDGPIPDDRMSVMVEFGQVITVHKGSNRGSYLAALGLVLRRHWPADDLVLMAEDDYLYRPESLLALLDAARTYADTDYFFPYSESEPPAVVAPQSPLRWVPHPSTTSTFAARMSALSRDRWLLRVAPLTGGSWDHASLLSVQGRQPYGLAGTLRHPPAPAHSSMAKRAARAMILTAAKSALAGLTWRQKAGRSRRALAARPPLATHMEDGHLAWGTDWAELAAAMTNR